MKKYDLVIFDMDGTILDTLEDLTDSLNVVLAGNGLAGHSLEEVRSFVGNGIRLLIERAVPEGTPEDVIDRVYRDYMEYYPLHCSERTKAYDGIPEVIRSLRQEGCLTAVVSNKADIAVQELCKQYFEHLFDFAAGEREGVRKKPAPDAVLEIMKRLGANPARTVYVGDSEVDIETAEHAGIQCITVNWGFRSEESLRAQGAELIVSKPQELLEYCLLPGSL